MAGRMPDPLGRLIPTEDASAPIPGFGGFADPRPLAGCSPDPKVDYTVPIVGFGQKTYMSCWFAAYAMMYAWSAAKDDSDECKSFVRDKLTDAGFDVDRRVRDGLKSAGAKEAGQILGFTGIKGTTFKAAKWTSIMAVMEERGPLWCGWGNHVVILAGMESTSKHVKVKYYDPFHPTNPTTADTDWSRLQEFLDHIRTHEYAVQFLEGKM